MAAQSDRDQAGRFKRAISGWPTSRLPAIAGNDFIAAVHADWQSHGAAVPDSVRKTNPAAYFRTVASLVPREILLDTRSDLSHLSDEELETQLYDLLAQVALYLKMPKLAEAIKLRPSDIEKRRGFNFQADLERLEAEISKRDNIRLIIIDSGIQLFGLVDSHKNADVRAVLEPLGEMAARMRVAIICNNHFSKGAGSANSRV